MAIRTAEKKGMEERTWDFLIFSWRFLPVRWEFLAITAVIAAHMQKDGRYDSYLLTHNSRCVYWLIGR